MNWKNTKVAIIGLGIEGMSSAAFFVKQGAIVTVLDRQSEEEVDTMLLAGVKKLGASVVFGTSYLDDLSYDLIIRSPGVPISHEKLQKAKENGIEITSQTQVFMDLCPCPIIGVTGT